MLGGGKYWGTKETPLDGVRHIQLNYWLHIQLHCQCTSTYLVLDREYGVKFPNHIVDSKVHFIIVLQFSKS